MATDFSAVDRLVVDLTSAPAEARPFIRRAIQQKSQDIRDETQDEAARTGLEAYGASIGYTTTELPASIKGEVGPTPGRRQGSFGFVEEGGSGVKSAPQHVLRDSMKRHLPDALEQLAKAASQGLDKAVGG